MPALYTVSEGEGAVEVCVTAADSVQLARPISYSVQTIDDSAMGKSIQVLQVPTSAVSRWRTLASCLRPVLYIPSCQCHFST
jgi:hypothetical protein